ncbi:MAG: 30S ribosomal protein S21 [Desulfobacteraceae bacterium]|nr:30S ribosomal protein S21 [Desulfobacteraceae bacterium]RJP87815.1 MAG: 30S ribosomal protein S21 [Desulfobacteraceae bacterium]
MTVRVDDNDVERAMRILKKKIQNDGLFKRLKLKKNYEKPSEYRRRKKREALRRQRIAESKRNSRFQRY